MSKMSAEVPKGDGWGIEEAVSDAVRKIQAGENTPLIPVTGVIDIKELKIDPATHIITAVVRIRRLEALTTVDQMRTAQRMIMERWAERKGEGAVLPFENDDILKRAFGGQPVGEGLQDDEEQAIDAEIDDDGRLRRHLVAVHDYNPAIITDDETTTADAERFHDTDHAKDPDDRTWPDHDPESRMWRRVDLAEMLGDAEEPVTETDQADPDGDEDPEGHGIRKAEDVMQENADADDAAGLIPEFRPESDEE